MKNYELELTNLQDKIDTYRREIDIKRKELLDLETKLIGVKLEKEKIEESNKLKLYRR